MQIFEGLTVENERMGWGYSQHSGEEEEEQKISGWKQLRYDKR